MKCQARLVSGFIQREKIGDSNVITSRNGQVQCILYHVLEKVGKTSSKQIHGFTASCFQMSNSNEIDSSQI